MNKNNNRSFISPTVLKVIQHFISSLRFECHIAKEKIDLLSDALQKGDLLTPDEINRILFDPQQAEKK